VATKVLLITNIPTPYRIPLFNALHDELAHRGIGFKVIFGALGYARRKWRIDMDDCSFPYEVLPTTPLHFSDPEQSAFTYRGLFRVLRQEQPTVIITNGFSVATTKLWLRSFTHQTPYIIWSGAICSPNKTEHRLRRRQRKLLIQRAGGLIAYGSRARDYLLRLGAHADDVSIGINTVDTSFYAKAATEFREKFHTDAAPKHLVYIGHLVPRKQVDRLLRVIKCLSLERHDFEVEIIGSGGEESHLKVLSKELGLERLVHFEGFKQKEDIIGYLASAYCLLFPTRYDPWGLVLVEAMAAGVPCISSVDAGATCDLIEDGKTGFAVDFSDLDGVTKKLHWLLDHPAECERMGHRARSFVADQVSLRKSTEGFVAAVERVLIKQGHRTA
jgi:glycosyltransferase involved in cell wall biosynthesis